MPKTKPLNKRDVPATVGLVKEVRNELRADMRALREDVKSEIASVKGELKSEIASVNTNLKSEISKTNSSLHRLESEVAKIKVLVEEQRSENRIVLDGFNNFRERQDRFEVRLDEMHDTLKVIRNAVSARH